ncbi:GNAT family N-acetyltransferase [Halobacillus locisalis]|uniref:GNAT family N-acetyltransferase n=1 Tax=Halobacillus locisalis TaxID=220753 RepID=A0A838CWX1_9BACI|nr:GNAT family protein [Halobacillus locisalis]MBA2176411.1 GNAT family N-acetyltransferase [Halobacillus locisalis]
MFVHKIDEELSIKLIGLEDAEELFALADESREHLATWLPWINFTKSPEDTKQFIQSAMKRYGEADGLTVCILYKGAIAGTIDLHAIDWKNRKTSIGYWMGAKYKGKGLLTRSCQALFTYAFRDLGLNRIEIRADVRNTKSWAVPERLGFEKEGVIREAAMLYDEPSDHVVYGMLEKDWQDHKEN